MFSGHVGTYFGRGMEFRSDLENIPKGEIVNYLNSPWGEKSNEGSTKLIKSHDWAYRLPFIKDTFPDEWIMLIYRPDASSFNWWKGVGGFNITYPSYAEYKNDQTMQVEIAEQNAAILKFGSENNVTWSYLTNQWVEDNIGQSRVVLEKLQGDHDILVALIKPV